MFDGANDRGSRGPAGRWVPAVDRAARILTLLAGGPDSELGVSDISRHLGLNKSTAHAILATLCAHRLVERDPRTRRYRPGPALPALAGSPHDRASVTASARPALEALLDGSGETVFLAVFRDDHVVLVDKAESHLDMGITSPLGRRIPHSAGALGKVFHAWMAEGELRSLLRRRPLRSFTDRTMTDRATYFRELGLVRELGVAFDDEEYLQGVRAVAAPIFGARHEVAAALCVVGPSARLGREEMGRVADQMRGLANTVSARLGGEGPREPKAGVG